MASVAPSSNWLALKKGCTGSLRLSRALNVLQTFSTTSTGTSSRPTKRQKLSHRSFSLSVSPPPSKVNETIVTVPETKAPPNAIKPAAKLPPSPKDKLKEMILNPKVDSLNSNMKLCVKSDHIFSSPISSSTDPESS